jgi:hypothetical protein
MFQLNSFGINSVVLKKLNHCPKMQCRAAFCSRTWSLLGKVVNRFPFSLHTALGLFFREPMDFLISAGRYLPNIEKYGPLTHVQ